MTRGAAAAAALWTPVFRIEAATAGGVPAPPAFPEDVPVYRQAYQNWSQQITVDGLWTCAPRTAVQVVTLANWALANGYRLRARGMMHGWSPLTVTPGSSAERVVLVDTTQYLTGIQLVSAAPPVIRAQAGATMDSLLAYLETNGLGVTAAPAPGDITIGGALAIDAHGTAVPAQNEERLPGHTYGSLSNLILSLTAVIWNAKRRAYELRRFERSEAEAKALLVHLGRTFVTEVELPVQASELATSLIEGDGSATPLFGQTQYDVTSAGLPATLSQDIWGPSKDLLLYILPTTIRATANGYAVLCRRADVQRVVSEFASFFLAHVAAYRAQGSYPVNMPVEIRVTGLDRPGDVGSTAPSPLCCRRCIRDPTSQAGIPPCGSTS